MCNIIEWIVRAGTFHSPTRRKLNYTYLSIVYQLTLYVNYPYKYITNDADNHKMFINSINDSK